MAKGMDPEALSHMDDAVVAAGGHGRLPPADPSAALAIAQHFGTQISPVISIPVVAVAGLLSWQRQSFTPAALLLLFAGAAAQTLSIWPAFFGLYAIFFIVTSAVKPSRQTGIAFVFASILLPTVLPAIFTYLLPGRMATISLFLLNSNPAFCLPRPSQTLQYAERYTIPVALFGQIPYGVAVSYAAAAALAFSSRLKSGVPRILGALLGAFAMAAAASVALPICGERNEESKFILDHIDGRSIAWGDRETIIWTDGERYGVFVLGVTLAGVAAWVLDGILADRASQSSKSSQAEKIKEEGAVTEDILGYARQLLANAIVSAIVVVGMALWSQRGNVEEE